MSAPKSVFFRSTVHDSWFPPTGEKESIKKKNYSTTLPHCEWFQEQTALSLFNRESSESEKALSLDLKRTWQQILSNCLSFLSPEEQARVSRTCTLFKAASGFNSVIRRFIPERQIVSFRGNLRDLITSTYRERLGLLKNPRPALKIITEGSFINGVITFEKSDQSTIYEEVSPQHLESLRMVEADDAVALKKVVIEIVDRFLAKPAASVGIIQVLLSAGLYRSLVESTNFTSYFKGKLFKGGTDRYERIAEFYFIQNSRQALDLNTGKPRPVVSFCYRTVSDPTLTFSQHEKSTSLTIRDIQETMRSAIYKAEEIYLEFLKDMFSRDKAVKQHDVHIYSDESNLLIRNLIYLIVETGMKGVSTGLGAPVEFQMAPVGYPVRFKNLLSP